MTKTKSVILGISMCILIMYPVVLWYYMQHYAFLGYKLVAEHELLIDKPERPKVLERYVVLGSGSYTILWNKQKILLDPTELSRDVYHIKPKTYRKRD
jgi:hypothetical protein